MANILKRFWFEESGQGLAEYGLILALIAIACIAALGTLGGGIASKLEKVGNTINPQQ
ncbi:MAG TPA: Flp family type IVb pilin [Bacillota bacterium]|nr:Flp family type IVb pilin [Bacillota bacterium]